MKDDLAWNQWFDFQYDLREDVRALLRGGLDGRSDAFKVAVYSGLIETLAEDMRKFITLTASAHDDV